MFTVSSTTVIPPMCTPSNLPLFNEVSENLKSSKIFPYKIMSFRSSAYFPFDFFYLFGVLRRFQHCTGHIMTGSWKGRGNQYI